MLVADYDFMRVVFRSAGRAIRLGQLMSLSEIDVVGPVGAAEAVCDPIGAVTRTENMI